MVKQNKVEIGGFGAYTMFSELPQESRASHWTYLQYAYTATSHRAPSTALAALTQNHLEASKASGTPCMKNHPEFPL